MITRQELLAFDFYKKKPFLGSDKGMRYRIEKKEISEEETKLKASIWPEPYCYEATNPDSIQCHLEDFSEDGLLKTIDWLNSMQPNYIENMI